METPEILKFFKNKPIMQVSCGGYHTMVITRNYEVYSWGSGYYGELGNNDNMNCLTPTQVNVYIHQKFENMLDDYYEVDTRDSTLFLN